MRTVPETTRRDCRQGFTLLEIAVCAAMLATLLALVGKAIVATEHGLRRADDRAAATRAVENLLEEFLAAPWDAVDQRAIDQLALPSDLAERWPQAVLKGSVAGVEEPAPAKRVSLQLQLRPADRGRPVIVTTWIYRAPEATR